MSAPYYRPLRVGEPDDWMIPLPGGLARRDLPAPGDPCIYFLFCDGEPIYIGQSRNVRTRLKSHRRRDWGAFEPDAAGIWFVPDQPLKPLEMELIARLNPRFNVEGRTNLVNT